MSIGTGHGENIVNIECDDELVVTPEVAHISGWVTIREYRPFPGGVVQPVNRRVYCGFFGRVAPKFPIN